MCIYIYIDIHTYYTTTTPGVLMYQIMQAVYHQLYHFSRAVGKLTYDAAQSQVSSVFTEECRNLIKNRLGGF